MVNINHFVITLFNIKMYDRDKSSRDVCTDEWLRDRFELFERYCLPSMAQQTERDFVWLCFFDAGTLVMKERIDSYKALVPQFTPVYLDEKDALDWRRHICEQILKFTPPHDAGRSCQQGLNLVVTTNLDNDDCLHRDAIKAVRNAVMREQRPGLYVMPSGFQYFKSMGIMLKMHYPHNHFMSLCEDLSKGIKTVKHSSHGGMRRTVDFICDICDRPYWIETVHARNVANDVRVTSRIRYSLPSRSTRWNDYVPGDVFGGLKGRGVTACVFAGMFMKACVRKLVRKLS